uniref:Putative CENPB/ARS binding proteinlike protein n=1 Tax=Albugo laibachii Nc14 TaxID=890382 RepID=F0X1J4_9STRA|nr:putative CENPB/ARS binding proteinlike protein [Albugo laibachii Nc14]|eukprot:CCA27684.1 putative CENPB/ARS binding proteinlike protein [Albugo laibachii Nc14]
MLSVDLIKAIAKRFASLSVVQDDQLLSFSKGWVQAFQKRQGFRHMSARGESGSVNIGAISLQRDAIRERSKGVSLGDMYNMDETELFHCLALEKTIARRQVEGSKKRKTRVTVALTCNAEGSDKCEPFIIGHANKPRCFQKKSGDQLGFYFRNNLKAWMTGALFQEWLQEFDDDMGSQRRNVVLILDNALAHTVYNMELQSVTAVPFLPTQHGSCSQWTPGSLRHSNVDTHIVSSRSHLIWMTKDLKPTSTWLTSSQRRSGTNHDGERFRAKSY